jgi:hypothetical protein
MRIKIKINKLGEEKPNQREGWGRETREVAGGLPRRKPVPARPNHCLANESEAEERRSHQQRGGSLKPTLLASFTFLRLQHFFVLIVPNLSGSGSTQHKLINVHMPYNEHM